MRFYLGKKSNNSITYQAIHNFLTIEELDKSLASIFDELKSIKFKFIDGPCNHRFLSSCTLKGISHCTTDDIFFSPNIKIFEKKTLFSYSLNNFELIKIVMELKM